MAESWLILRDVVLAGLAACQAADTWLQGSLFRRPREAARRDRQLLENRTEWRSRATAMLLQGLTCDFCLKHHLAWLGLLLLRWPASAGFWLVCWLAAVRVAVLLSDETFGVIRDSADAEVASSNEIEPDEAQ